MGPLHEAALWPFVGCGNTDRAEKSIKAASANCRYGAWFLWRKYRDTVGISFSPRQCSSPAEPLTCRPTHLPPTATHMHVDRHQRRKHCSIFSAALLRSGPHVTQDTTTQLRVPSNYVIVSEDSAPPQFQRTISSLCDYCASTRQSARQFGSRDESTDTQQRHVTRHRDSRARFLHRSRMRELPPVMLNTARVPSPLSRQVVT